MSADLPNAISVARMHQQRRNLYGLIDPNAGSIGPSGGAPIWFATLAAMAAAPGPSIQTLAWQMETDAPYEFVVGSNVAADGWTAVAPTGGTAGRWLLRSDRISIGPIGAGDAARIAAARNALAGKGRIEYRAGAWLWDSAHQMPDNLVEVWLPGSTFTSSLPANAAELNAPFNANRAPVTTSATTVRAPGATIGSKVLPVTSAAALAVGAYISVLSAVVLRVATYRIVARNLGANTVTLDRVVRMDFPAGSTIDVVTPPMNIFIEGNGLKVRGTGDRGVEIVAGWACEVCGLDVAGFSDYIVGYDRGSYNCAFRRIQSDALSAATAAFAVESSELMELEDCDGTGAGGYGFFVWSSIDVDVYGGSFHDNNGGGSAVGCYVSVGDAVNTEGCSGLRFFGTTFSGNTTNGVLIDASSSIEFHGCESNDNGSAGYRLGVSTSGVAASGVRWIGGAARRNVGPGIAVAGGAIDNLATGTTFEDNTDSSPSVSNGDLVCIGCTVIDRGRLPGGTGQILTNGASASMRFEKGSIRTTTTNGVNGMQVAGGSKMTLDGVKIDAPNGDAGTAILTTGASLILMRDIVSTGRAAGLGFQSTAGGTLRMRGRVDLTSTGAAFTIDANAFVNRRTGNGAPQGSIALTSNVAVTYRFPDVKADDDVSLTLRAPGGTQGVSPSFVVTPGTGVVITGIVNDTSTYDVAISA